MEQEVPAAIITDIAREILKGIAPEELLIFEPAANAYFLNPTAALKQARSKDSVLGFGTNALPLLLAPIVLQISSEVIEFLEGVAKKVALEDGLKTGLPQLVKAMLQKVNSAPGSEAVVLTAEQARAIRLKALLTAEEYRVPRQTAEAIANAVVAQLTPA